MNESIQDEAKQTRCLVCGKDLSGLLMKDLVVKIRMEAKLQNSHSYDYNRYEIVHHYDWFCIECDSRIQEAREQPSSN